MVVGRGLAVEVWCALCLALLRRWWDAWDNGGWGDGWAMVVASHPLWAGVWAAEAATGPRLPQRCQMAIGTDIWLYQAGQPLVAEPPLVFDPVPDPLPVLVLPVDCPSQPACLYPGSPGYLRHCSGCRLGPLVGHPPRSLAPPPARPHPQPPHLRQSMASPWSRLLLDLLPAMGTLQRYLNLCRCNKYRC